MDDIVHAARDALLEHFRDLTIQFRQNHAAWQEAGRVHDRPCQAALIAREEAILTASKEVIAGYQATLAPRHR